MGCTCNKQLKSAILDINEEQENYKKEREEKNLDEINIGETIINGNENENEEINEKNNPPFSINNRILFIYISYSSPKYKQSKIK